MMLRSDHPGNRHDSCEGGGCDSRLNLLLSCAQWRRNSSFDHLPHVLEPLGIRSILARSGTEAANVITQNVIHIAVVDLAIPLEQCCDETEERTTEGGARILHLLRRLSQPPPTVVVRPRQAASRESTRGLTQALREGAFAVLDQPVHIESMLEVMRRILRRHYANCWPR